MTLAGARGLLVTDMAPPMEDDMLKPIDRRAFLLGGATLAAVPLTTWGARPAFAARDQIVVRTDMDIGSLDPGNRVGSVEDNIILAACQMLARFNPGTLEWSNDAAKTITQVSDTEYEFELNPGQMFTGGYGEMTAEDVKYTYDRFINGDANGNKLAYAEDLEALERVEVTGKYTGRLILKHPSPALWLIGLCDGSGAILSKKAVEELGDKIATTLIGSGPYMLTEWRPKEQFVLEANPDYAGRDVPNFKRVVAKPISEPKTALLAFQAGEIDFTEIDPVSAPEIRKKPDAKLIEMDGIDYTWIGINVEKGPLADLKVRQAIRYGIDVDAIIAGAYSGTVQRAKTLLAPALLGSWKDAPLYPHDVEKAKALLDEAGQSGLDLTFTCLNDATSQAVAQIAQANLAEIGINIAIHALDGGAYWAMGSDDKSKDLELTLIPYSSKFDPSFQTQWFLSEQVGVWNWQRWKNAEFDKLHQDGLSTTDPKAREAIYIQMQKLLDESASCIWITHGVHDFVHAAWLKPMILPNGSNWQFQFFAEA
jgi:peptide/nickel transport system substrate-binding protein